MLFFLNRNDRKKNDIPLEKAAWTMRHDRSWPEVISLGTIPRNVRAYPALTEDFNVLVSRDSILECARRAIAATPVDVAPRSWMLEVPDDTPAFRAVNAGSAVLLTIPVDAKLESRARAWCKSRSAETRAEGAAILRSFKNENNIELLKSLLNDPTTTESAKYDSSGEGGNLKLIYRKKVYYVRRAAFDSLLKLGVQVPKPLLEVLLEGRDEPEEEFQLDFCAIKKG